MANDVYANGREISCKAADGKAICAFPDVCFTPPTTPATPPGVPIPYPNTAFAKDTTSGSKTVQISGKEVMLKNKSYFKTSTGDEAGSAPKKGIITSKIKGKAYFNAWSMDVKFEGQNVVRHLDLTTHNHASPPGQTPPWAYLDTMAIQIESVTDPCKDVRRDVKEACGKNYEKNTYKKGKRKGQVNTAALKRDMCKDKNCQDAMKCVLVPFSVGCCKGKTPHHVIPAHCFMPPGERSGGGGDRYRGCEHYDQNDAPCICATGKDKSKKRKQHAKLHKHFDAVEDDFKAKGGTWTYEQAAGAGADSVRQVMGCDEKCTKAQLAKYHGEDKGISTGTMIRADSSGKGAPAPTLQISTASGILG
jgi:hypothetical protein